MGLFHRHHWVTVSAKQMAWQNLIRRGPRIGEPLGPPEPITEVLQRCSDCGDVRTKQLDSHWTLAELLKETP